MLVGVDLCIKNLLGARECQCADLRHKLLLSTSPLLLNFSTCSGFDPLGFSARGIFRFFNQRLRAFVGSLDNASGFALGICELLVRLLLGILQVMPVQECDQVLSYLPLCHVAEKIFSVFLPLSSGAVVHFGESIETVRADLREVSPTVFLGVPRIWEKMHASVSLKMKDASWLKRVLYEWASAAGKDISERRLAGRPKVLDRLTWWLADFLVFRPLQEKLGMRRWNA